jgi:hypothetical protein
MAGAVGQADEGIVEIEIADHHAIGEDREIGAGLDAADQDGRWLSGADVARKLGRDPAWACRVAAIGAADRVEEGALGEPHNIVGQVLVFQMACVTRERFGESSGSGISLGPLLCEGRKTRCHHRSA